VRASSAIASNVSIGSTGLALPKASPCATEQAVRKSGEGAGTASERDRVEVGHRTDASASSRRIVGRKVADALAPAFAFVLPDPASRRQRDADALGGGIEGKEGVHHGAQQAAASAGALDFTDGTHAIIIRMQVGMFRSVALVVLSLAMSAASAAPHTGSIEVDSALARAKLPAEALVALVQEVGANPPSPRLAGGPAGQSGLGHQARHDLRRARAARPGVHLDHAGLAARAVVERRPAGRPRDQGLRRSEAGARAHLAAAAARAAAGRARDPRRHRARPIRLLRAGAEARPTSTANRCAPTTCAPMRCC
jgi:hypothetical protein